MYLKYNPIEHNYNNWIILDVFIIYCHVCTWQHIYIYLHTYIHIYTLHTHTHSYIWSIYTEQHVKLTTYCELFKCYTFRSYKILCFCNRYFIILYRNPLIVWWDLIPINNILACHLIIFTVLILWCHVFFFKYISSASNNEHRKAFGVKVFFFLEYFQNIWVIYNSSFFFTIWFSKI